MTTATIQLASSDKTLRKLVMVSLPSKQHYFILTKKKGKKYAFGHLANFNTQFVFRICGVLCTSCAHKHTYLHIHTYIDRYPCDIMHSGRWIKWNAWHDTPKSHLNLQFSNGISFWENWADRPTIVSIQKKKKIEINRNSSSNSRETRNVKRDRKPFHFLWENILSLNVCSCIIFQNRFNRMTLCVCMRFRRIY